MSKARAFTVVVTLLFSVAACGCSKATKSAAETPGGPALGAGGTGPTTSAHALPPKTATPGKAFEGGPVDLCLVLSGQMHGYLQPCGCSRPQIGGLERRYELMKRLQGHGYPLSAADLGDLGPKDEIGPQSRWKFETAANALKAMSYAAVTLGPVEIGMPIDTALDLVQNYKPPLVLASNLVLREPELYADVVAPWMIDDPRKKEDVVSLVGKLHGHAMLPLAGPGGVAAVVHALPVSNRPRVGYFGLIGESVQVESQKKGGDVKFTPSADALAKHLPAFLAAGAEFRVLLLQGTSDEARALVKKHPKTFHIVLCRSDADVPPLLPFKDDSGAWIIMVGHKGKNVGVLAYRRGKPMDYRLEELVEELELPDGKTNPIREVMKDYVWGVYRNGYLQNVPRISHPNQLIPELKDAVFVGSAKCSECHRQAHTKWSSSQHGHAWESLVKYGRPIAEVPQKGQAAKLVGRQFDPDCVRCHVTGFGFKGGFESAEKTPHLFGNGCENCHGPGSLHAGQPGNAIYREPMRLAIRDRETEQKCRKCHDVDNDPHFEIQKWLKIEHGKEK
jgi:hypothetical protein